MGRESVINYLLNYYYYSYWLIINYMWINHVCIGLSNNCIYMAKGLYERLCPEHEKISVMERFRYTYVQTKTMIKNCDKIVILLKTHIWKIRLCIHWMCRVELLLHFHLFHAMQFSLHLLSHAQKAVRC